MQSIYYTQLLCVWCVCVCVCVCGVCVCVCVVCVCVCVVCVCVCGVCVCVCVCGDQSAFTDFNYHKIFRQSFSLA